MYSGASAFDPLQSLCVVLIVMTTLIPSKHRVQPVSNFESVNVRLAEDPLLFLLAFRLYIITRRFHQSRFIRRVPGRYFRFSVPSDRRRNLFNQTYILGLEPVLYRLMLSELLCNLKLSVRIVLSVCSNEISSSFFSSSVPLQGVGCLFHTLFSIGKFNP